VECALFKTSCIDPFLYFVMFSVPHRARPNPAAPRHVDSVPLVGILGSRWLIRPSRLRGCKSRCNLFWRIGVLGIWLPYFTGGMYRIIRNPRYGWTAWCVLAEQVLHGPLSYLDVSLQGQKYSLACFIDVDVPGTLERRIDDQTFWVIFNDSRWILNTQQRVCRNTIKF
jgi:hypothetical protein